MTAVRTLDFSEMRSAFSVGAGKGGGWYLSLTTNGIAARIVL